MEFTGSHDNQAPPYEGKGKGPSKADWARRSGESMTERRGASIKARAMKAVSTAVVVGESNVDTLEAGLGSKMKRMDGVRQTRECNVGGHQGLIHVVEMTAGIRELEVTPRGLEDFVPPREPPFRSLWWVQSSENFANAPPRVEGVEDEEPGWPREAQGPRGDETRRGSLLVRFLCDSAHCEPGVGGCQCFSAPLSMMRWVICWSMTRPPRSNTEASSRPDKVLLGKKSLGKYGTTERVALVTNFKAETGNLEEHFPNHQTERSRRV